MKLDIMIFGYGMKNFFDMISYIFFRLWTKHLQLHGLMNLSMNHDSKNDFLYYFLIILFRDDIAGLDFVKKTIQEIVIWPMLRPYVISYYYLR